MDERQTFDRFLSGRYFRVFLSWCFVFLIPVAVGKELREGKKTEEPGTFALHLTGVAPPLSF